MDIPENRMSMRFCLEDVPKLNSHEGFLRDFLDERRPSDHQTDEEEEEEDEEEEEEEEEMIFFL